MTSTSHIRRIEAGIMSYGQDIDVETNPCAGTAERWWREPRLEGASSVS